MAGDATTAAVRAGARSAGAAGGRRPLIVVLPGIGDSVLARPGRPDDIVWDQGKADIAGLVFRPDRLDVDESEHLEPLGLTESTKFLGFTVVPGYETLLGQLRQFGAIDERGDPAHPVSGAEGGGGALRLPPQHYGGRRTA